MNVYKNCTKKPYSLLVIDTTLASDNHLHFRKNLSERIEKLIMTTDDKIRDEKLQYDFNSEAAKISALSSRKIDKYEFLTGEEILPPDRRRVIEQSTFAYSPLENAFKKTKTNWSFRSSRFRKKIRKINWKNFFKTNDKLKNGKQN